MIEVKSALTNALRADPNLASMIGSYLGGSSVFPFSPIPEDATNPFVVVGGPIADSEYGVKREDVREVTVDVGVYGDANGDYEAVARPADYIRRKIRSWERVEYAVINWNVISVNAAGPLENDLDDLYGRVVSFTFILERL